MNTPHRITGLLLFLLLIPVFAPAQQLMWDSTGVPICTADGWQRYPRLVTDGDGGAIIAWEDIRVGSNPAIYAARVTRDGAAPWGENGVEISGHLSGQRMAGIVSDGGNGAYIAFWNRAGGESDLFLQRIDGNGSAQWATGGITVCDADGRQEWAEMIPDGQGGVIIAWQDGRGDDNDIYAQRFTREGTALWTANGELISDADGDQNYPQLATDQARGAFITWMDRRSEDDIYAQYVKADGTVAWEEDLPVCIEINRQVAPKVLPYGDNSAVFFWQDYRLGPSTSSLYLQIINEEGEKLYLDDFQVSQSNNAQSGMFLTDDGRDGALAVWTDYRAGAGEGDVYMRRILADGTIIGDFGNALCDYANTQERPTMISDGEGGGFAVWQDKRNTFDYDIYMNRISKQGLTNYPEWNNHDGVLVVTHDNNQLAPQVISGGPGYALVCWYDGRTLDGQADIYAQRIAWSPSLAFPDSIDFGINKVGQTVHDTVRIWNDGATPLTVTNVRRASNPANTHPADFTMYPSFEIPKTLNPGDDMLIPLSFTPGGIGDRISELRISSDAPQDPVVIPLHGLGTNPRLRTKNVHQFNVTKVGATNEEMVEDMLQNTGTGVLLITNIEFDGADAAKFDLGSNPPFPLTLEENEYFPLKVTFSPDGVGTFETMMKVYSNAGSGSEDVRLAGFGARPALITIPVGLHFDSTMETSSVEAQVNVRNTSGVELVVTAIQLAGQDPDQFALDAELPMRIPGEGLQPFTVYFRPTSTGMKKALIVLTSDAPSSPDDMVVDGVGTILSSDRPSAVRGFAIDAVYPQPLRPSRPLGLRFTLPSYQSDVRILLYDLLGRELAILFEGRLSAGSGSLQLALDHLDLAPGLYTLQLTSGDRRAARSIVISR